jgi:hypothetical protein
MSELFLLSVYLMRYTDKICYQLSDFFVSWTLSLLCVCDRYKTHLLCKTWDRLAQAKMFGRVGANEAAVIIDYGQKVEPTGQIESQSECFGKVGISPSLVTPF